jgi:hypothetical protein
MKRNSIDHDDIDQMMADDLDEKAEYHYTLLYTQAEMDAALTKAIADERAMPTPIPMVLTCPKCGWLHVDQEESENDYSHRRNKSVRSGATPESISSRWTNPPHKSHLCHNCGIVWRPADVATTGVENIQTRGKADTWPTIRRDDTADTQTEGEGR